MWQISTERLHLISIQPSDGNTCHRQGPVLDSEPYRESGYTSAVGLFYIRRFGGVREGVICGVMWVKGLS